MYTSHFIQLWHCLIKHTSKKHYQMYIHTIVLKAELCSIFLSSKSSCKSARHVISKHVGWDETLHWQNVFLHVNLGGVVSISHEMLFFLFLQSQLIFDCYITKCQEGATCAFPASVIAWIMIQPLLFCTLIFFFFGWWPEYVLFINLNQSLFRTAHKVFRKFRIVSATDRKMRVNTYERTSIHVWFCRLHNYTNSSQLSLYRKKNRLNLDPETPLLILPRLPSPPPELGHLLYVRSPWGSNGALSVHSLLLNPLPLPFLLHTLGFCTGLRRCSY